MRVALVKPEDDVKLLPTGILEQCSGSTGVLRTVGGVSRARHASRDVL